MKELLSVVLSVAAALAVFLILFLFLKWNLILCMLLGVGVYVAFTMIFKPTERIGKVDISSLSNGELLHEKLGEADVDYQRIRRASVKIKDSELRKQCMELTELAESILKYLTKNPVRISAARRYIDYYQETAAGILEHYLELQETKVSTGEIQKAIASTKEAVATLQAAFQMQFEKLMQNELMDMEADLNLLKQTLYSEGYQENKQDKAGTE